MRHRPGTQDLLDKVHSFIDQTCADIELDEDVNRATCKARWLAKFLEVNYCGIYRLDRIEEALVRKMQPLPANTATAQTGYLFVASEVYSHGGHTPLLKSLFTACEDSKAICVTRALQRESALEILQTPADKVIFTQGRTEVAKIKELAQLIASYDKVLLVIHPDDINCAAAARLAKMANPALRIGFINHSDHTFSVGVGIADIVFEISSFGWAMRDQRGTLQKSSFMGIPIAPVSEKIIAKEPIALTGGSWYKFKPSQGRSIMPYLRALLYQMPELTLYVVGPNLLLNPWWWNLKLNYPRRLRIFPLLPKSQYQELLWKAKIYIDSYPITGGMAFTESVSYKCLPVGLEVPLGGYSALDSCRVTNEDDFLSYIVNKTSSTDIHKHWLNELDIKVNNTHRPDICLKRIQDGIEYKIIITPPAKSVKQKNVNFFQSNWLKQCKVNFPTIIDIRSDLQLSLINSYSAIEHSNYLVRKYRTIRSQLVRFFFK